MAAHFERLVQIMNELRAQCPWDKKQTIQSLRQMTVEEMYELNDAVLDNDWAGIKEELGDLLLHIVFYSKIAAEQGQFTIEDVVQGICEKLVRRHPHIYGGQMGQALRDVATADDVKKNWETLKLKEGKSSVLSGIPRSLPPVTKAMRLQDKAGQAGFEWEDKQQVWDKVQEEMNELAAAVNNNNMDEAAAELGDVLFSIINYSRYLHIDAEAALALTNEKFIKRFTAIEAFAAANGTTPRDMTLQQMDAVWNAAKEQK